MTAPSRVTLLDVAQRAGVSRTTASFVLTGRRDMRISAEAEERVRRAARELNYRPSLIARSLRTKLTKTIGLISDTIASDAFGGELIRGALTKAVLLEQLMFVGETEGSPQVEKRLVEDMLDRGVGGFVYASMYTRQARISTTLRAHPLVLLNCVTRSQRIPSVVPDEREAGRDAVRTLRKAGHGERIWMVGEEAAHVIAGRERRAGVDETLAEDGLHLAATIDCLWWPQAARIAVGSALRELERPTAMICLNDRVAFGAYQALAEAGLRIPDDVSVVSFDDSDLASWLHPQLTTLAIPHAELGRRAVEILLSAPTEGGTHRVPMPLRERASVAPPSP